MHKVALVTGTSTGIGLSLSLRLAKMGVKVYATMRNIAKKGMLEKFAARQKLDVTILQMDVTDTGQIEETVGNIIKYEGKVDFLINNAGMGFMGTTEFIKEADLEALCDTNMKGVFRCTKAVLPYMRKARSGRIVNLSSVNGLVGVPFGELYCASKFWVEGYIESLATYITPEFNIKFTLIEPGPTATEFQVNMLKDLQNINEEDYLNILNKMQSADHKKRFESNHIQSPDKIVDVISKCLFDENPPLRIRTSAWAEDFCELKVGLDPTGLNIRNKIIQEVLDMNI